MTYEELLERLADPASAGRGGHAPIVQLLESNSEARATMKAFGAVERFYTPESAAAPPEDFDRRLIDRINLDQDAPARARAAAPSVASAAGGRPPLVAVGVIAVVALGAFLLLRGGSTSPAPAAAPSAVQPLAPAAAKALSLDDAPLSDEERARVTGMYDPEFVSSVELLAGLDPFFDEDVVPLVTAGPPAPNPTPTAAPRRPPESEEALTMRLASWRRLSRADRARLLALDDAYRAKPAEERRVLEARWMSLVAWTPEEKAAVRRLAGRLLETDPAARERLRAEIRGLRAKPAAERAAEFEKLPVAKSLTGQELRMAERLLAASS